jgi:LuxR family quorum sensing-dependent transcriptional regulator
MGEGSASSKSVSQDSQRAFLDLGGKLLAYASDVQSLISPEAILNDIHQILKSALNLNCMGAFRFPPNVSDWDALELGKTVFLHKSVPKGFWEEWRQRAPNHNPTLYFQSRLSLAPVTLTEMLAILAPIGGDRWGIELALKYRIRDAFICPVGGRWLVLFWSDRVLTRILTEPLRIVIFAAASFAVVRLDKLVETRAEREGAYTPLTPRELAVIRLLSLGKSIHEITGHLGLGEETIRTHLKKAKAKLGAQNLAQLVALAMRQRLIV